ncbi:MAG TPA: TIGR03621 family F420-dependent LLM class oxidoreductase [Ilumatobacter sp.]
MSRKFRFGAKAVKATSAKEWTDLVRQVEDLGYESFHMDDHFGNQLGVVPALMAAAAATSTLLVGPHVAGVDFRNPVLFAKECATIDLLSEGRFTLGIGAGWSEKDYAIAGIHQDNALTRIGRVREAVQIMKGLWGDGPFSFAGEHYRVAEVDAVPKPASRIPMMIGGGGPKILAVAAEHADIVGINPKIVGRAINPESMATTAADAMDEKVDAVRAAAGDRFAELELQVQIFKTVVTDRPQETAEQLAPAFGLPPEEALVSPHALAGTPEEMVEDLLAGRERWGISYIGVSADALDAMAPVVNRLAGS